MATKALDPQDVLAVADDLSKNQDEIDPTDWGSIESARCRSSASRAYYAVYSLMAAELWRVAGVSIPQANGHAVLFRAIRDSLPRGHKVTKRFEALLDFRRDADYELTGDYTRAFAEDRCDDAEDLFDGIKSLGDSWLSNVGNRVKG